MDKKKMKFAIFGNHYQARKSVSIMKLLNLLKEMEAEVYIDKEFYEYLVDEFKLTIPHSGLIVDNNFEADFVLSMGGDGTFLKAAGRVGDKHIPIIGINMGRLGFLADVSASEIESSIHAIYRGDYAVEERSVLRIESDGMNLNSYPFALNEIAVLKRDNSSMISIHAWINGEFLTVYQADGLIICTPTGSTGYSLSVGGPIIVPTSHSIGITPIAPHSLNMRPLIMSDDAVITLKVASRSHNYLLAIDGRNNTCREDTTLTIRRANYRIAVVKRKQQSFFSTLRQKLMWGADARE
jgi:NAD+ kinase